jgi:hypothetical protein
MSRSATPDHLELLPHCEFQLITSGYTMRADLYQTSFHHMRDVLSPFSTSQVNLRHHNTAIYRPTPERFRDRDDGWSGKLDGTVSGMV